MARVYEDDIRGGVPRPAKYIFREYQGLIRDPLGGITAQPVNSICEWTGSIMAPTGSVFEGGLFQFTIVFKESSYPFSKPVIRFTTNIFLTCVEDR